MLKNQKIINYDLKEEYTDYKSYENLHFDIVIFNHVLMYLYPHDIDLLLDKLKKINPKCELILSLGKQNLVSKIAMLLTLDFNAHKDTRSSYEEQVDILLNKSTLIKKKLNIYGMTDIYYSKF